MKKEIYTREEVEELLEAHQKKILDDLTQKYVLKPRPEPITWKTTLGYLALVAGIYGVGMLLVLLDVKYEWLSSLVS